MENINRSREDQAMAQLVLNVTRSKSNLVGSKPTDEELTGFYENTLDATRRAQVMSYIAKDKDTYRRWIGLVELHSYVKSQATQVQPTVAKKQNTTSTPNESLVDRVKQFLFGDSWKLAGASFATVAVAVIVLSVVFNKNSGDPYTNYIDSLYRDSGTELSNNWANYSSQGNVIPNYPPTRSFFNVKSDARKVVELGFANGAKRLNADLFAMMGISVNKLTQDVNQKDTTFSETQYSTLYEIGRLNAFLVLQCSMDMKNATVSNAHERQRGLMSNAKAIDDADIRDLVSAFGTSQDPAISTCTTADSVARLVAR